jgi:hypothetical protein
MSASAIFPITFRRSYIGSIRNLEKAWPKTTTPIPKRAVKAILSTSDMAD